MVSLMRWCQLASCSMEIRFLVLFAKLILLPKPYYSIANLFPDEYFDLILVDGRNRKGCILHAIRTLKRGGVLMLDNAERPYYKKAIELLEGWKATSAVQNKPDSCNFSIQTGQQAGGLNLRDC